MCWTSKQTHWAYCTSCESRSSARPALLDDLYHSAARLHTTGAPILPLEYVIQFCKTFVPEQARYVPDKGEELSFVGRVTFHFRFSHAACNWNTTTCGVSGECEQYLIWKKRGSDFENGQLALAIQPLFDLLTRYAPSLSHLTTIHSIFLRVSLMLHLSPTFIQQRLVRCAYRHDISPRHFPFSPTQSQ